MSNEEFIMCKYHNSKKAKKFCSLCKEFLCNSCAFDNHLTHTREIKTLNELYIDDLTKTDVIEKKIPLKLDNIIKQKIEFFLFVLNYSHPIQNLPDTENIKTLFNEFDNYMCNIISCKNCIKNILQKRNELVEKVVRDNQKNISELQNKLAAKYCIDQDFINKINILHEKISNENNIDSLCELYTSYESIINELINDNFEEKEELFQQYKKVSLIRQSIKTYNEKLLSEIFEKKRKIIEETIKDIYTEINNNQNLFVNNIKDIIQQKQEEENERKYVYQNFYEKEEINISNKSNNNEHIKHEAPIPQKEIRETKNIEIKNIKFVEDEGPIKVDPTKNINTNPKKEQRDKMISNVIGTKVKDVPKKEENTKKSISPKKKLEELKTPTPQKQNRNNNPTDFEDELEFNPPKIEIHKKMTSELKFDENEFIKRPSGVLEPFGFIADNEILSNNHLIDGDDLFENNNLLKEIRSIPSLKSSSSTVNKDTGNNNGDGNPPQPSQISQQPIQSTITSSGTLPISKTQQHPPQKKQNQDNQKTKLTKEKTTQDNPNNIQKKNINSSPTKKNVTESKIQNVTASTNAQHLVNPTKFEPSQKIKEILALSKEKASSQIISNLVSSLSWEDRNMISIFAFGQNCKNVFIYNPFTNTIEEIEIEIDDPQYKFPTSHHFINVLPSVYLSGGKTDKNVELESIIQFTRIGEKKFSMVQVGTMKDKRNLHTSIFVPKIKSICFISGSRIKTCEVLNIETGQMSILPLLSCSRERASSCVINEMYLYVFFGFDRTKSKYVTTIEKLDLHRNISWETISIPGNQNILKKQGFSCMRYREDNKKGILLIGGINSLRNECREILFFNPENTSITLFSNILPINSSFTNPSFLSCQSSEHMSYNLTDGFIPIIFDKTQGKFIQGSG